MDTARDFRYDDALTDADARHGTVDLACLLLEVGEVRSIDLGSDETGHRWTRIGHPTRDLPRTFCVTERTPGSAPKYSYVPYAAIDQIIPGPTADVYRIVTASGFTFGVTAHHLTSVLTDTSPSA